MLRSISELRKCTLAAADGDIGSIEDVYVEDRSWTVRYVVVDSGTWLSGRKVLLSPMSFGKQHELMRLAVNLTKAQVKNSPDVDTAIPVSRQHELSFSGYYGYPPYWEGPYRWGGGPLPGYWVESEVMSRPSRGASAVEREVRARIEQGGDPHLRSANEILGYYLMAKDGQIGHVEELMIDDQDWVVRYMIIDTKNWWPGKKVVMSSAWVDRVSYDESTVHVSMTRDAIQSAPEYDRDSLDRSYEMKLHSHYQKLGYWDEPPESWRMFPPMP